MIDTFHSLLIIVVASLCTISMRFAPFIIFRNKKEIPAIVRYLGKYLPPAIVATLIIYCLKDIDLSKLPAGIPEFASILIVAGLHLWKRNTLLSIGCGTLFYMVISRLLLF